MANACCWTFLFSTFLLVVNLHLSGSSIIDWVIFVKYFAILVLAQIWVHWEIGGRDGREWWPSFTETSKIVKDLNFYPDFWLLAITFWRKVGQSLSFWSKKKNTKTNTKANTETYTKTNTNTNTKTSTKTNTKTKTFDFWQLESLVRLFRLVTDQSLLTAHCCVTEPTIRHETWS